MAIADNLFANTEAAKASLSWQPRSVVECLPVELFAAPASCRSTDNFELRVFI